MRNLPPRSRTTMSTDPLTALSASAAFIAGLAGSAHCFAMCGGMAGALGLRARANSASTAQVLAHSALYQFGRVSGYAFAGALSGLAGTLAWLVLDLARVGTALRVAGGVLLIFIALRLLLRWNGLALIERLGARFWSKLRPLAQREAQRPGTLNALTLGFLWGWLPCGLVYSILIFASTSGSAVAGATIMTMFGLGTLPSMLTSSLFAPQLMRRVSAQWSRTASGALLFSFGAWMIVTPLLAGGHGPHIH